MWFLLALLGNIKYDNNSGDHILGDFTKLFQTSFVLSQMGVFYVSTFVTQSCTTYFDVLTVFIFIGN